MRRALALAVGILTFAAVAAAGLLASRVATQRLRQDAAAELTQAARHIAETLDRGMFERWRDVQIAARHPVLRDPAATAEAKRAVLRTLQQTYPDYALLFLVAPDGHIAVTSLGILEGVDVSVRDYFTNGRKGPYAGDVHEAILLAGRLGNLPNGEPPRFIDLATPVTDTNGQSAGVLAAHLFWHWAERVEQGVLVPLQARRPGAETLVVATDGTVLLGPAALRGQKLPEFSFAGRANPAEAGTQLEPGPVGSGKGGFLVGYAPTQGHGVYPGLGWTVLVRQDSAAAFAIATELQREIFVWAAIISVAAALLSGLLAHVVTRPIRALTAIAERLASDPLAVLEAERDAVQLGYSSTYREGAALSIALAELIGSQRRATAALTGSEARFRALAEAVPLLLFETDAQGRNLYVNPRMEEFTGLSLAELLDDGWLRCLHPDDQAHASAAWMEAVRTGAPYEIDYRFIGRDGRVRWFLSRGVPVCDPQGCIVRWVGTCTDIDDRRQAETVLARDKAELAGLVAERTRDLQDTQAQLAQARRMEALGQLAGGIAHDVNNVLQAVQGAAALIEDAPHDPAEVRGLARLIADATERGASVTHRLLAFSRRGDLRAEPVAAAPLLAGLREILAHTLGTGIEVRLDVVAGLPPLLADKGQLETVLVNLATNARDAMPAGGVLTLAAALEAGPPVGPGEGCCVRLSVADTGIGMDPATLERASEPFFTTKPIGKGTGLGLAMARGFTEQSGGALRIDSAPGQGTTVTLRFPAAAALPPAAGTESGGIRAATGRARRPRLLVVDDEALVREMTVKQMERAGFDTLPAQSGKAALALLDAGERVDLIVSDLSMPGMDGVALLRAAQQRRPDLPAILLTGFATAAAETAVDGTRCVILRKPVRGKLLAEQVVASLAETVAVPA